MNDNKSAFSADSYDEKIRQTLPYYDEFYEQIIALIKVYNHSAVKWLDIGCGTGKMASVAFENVKIEKFFFCSY